ncbi:hypothetical protein M1P56_35635 (plasmid) [Streptomyces sp. HU2014]|uniref:hypothetical protein n=1 Tax=Streptomyces sp. HU2014 TaxID=2939414 RepID=UPI00200BDD99|nr:hypothetical protein [Streptomyces sp. HU2014]UQI49824.1 hypothetical protein M1P56_35635 [Streptomyces sp. HU2014]
MSACIPRKTPLEAARAAATGTPNPTPGSWAAHLHAALAEVDRLTERLARYGTPVPSAPSLPPPDPAYAQIERQRAELESGFTSLEWAVGMVLCPAREKCPDRLDTVFKPLKNGRLPMHRNLFGHACPGARKRPVTPPLKLRNADSAARASKGEEAS